MAPSTSISTPRIPAARATDGAQFLDAVELQALHYAETIPQR